MKHVTEYKNFWLIWIGSGCKETGNSLFGIQKDWGIRTNYLYHQERGLGKPLFREMIKQGYIRKDKKSLGQAFEWVRPYVLESNAMRFGRSDANQLLMANWQSVQSFMEAHRHEFFSGENIKALYRGSIRSIRNEGSKIFNDIFLFVLMQNVEPFCIRHGAEIVLRALNTVIANEQGRDLLSYFYRLKPLLSEAKDFPCFIRSENDLVAALGMNG